MGHKEKLKKLTSQVDVLTLSATPIPRTLNMALSGLRDMSTLEQPPTNRQPVQTYVLEHDWGSWPTPSAGSWTGAARSITSTTAPRPSTAPPPSSAPWWGRRPASPPPTGRWTRSSWGDIMSQMTDGELDILVCTTIIETGIDLPNVNTLIIENAETFGLAQLHQLRGRVGRSTRRASAYLTYRPSKVLTEDQSKRLSAIREYAAFGSGFKIAMRDLEIRGPATCWGPSSRASS